MTDNNFKCIDNGHEVFLTSYRKLSTGLICKKGTGTAIVCSVCQSNLIEIEKPFQGVPALGKFSMLNSSERKRSLKNRAAVHQKKIANEMRNDKGQKF